MTLWIWWGGRSSVLSGSSAGGGGGGGGGQGALLPHGTGDCVPASRARRLTQSSAWKYRIKLARGDTLNRASVTGAAPIVVPFNRNEAITGLCDPQTKFDVYSFECDGAGALNWSRSVWSYSGSSTCGTSKAGSYKTRRLFKLLYRLSGSEGSPRGSTEGARETPACGRHTDRTSIIVTCSIFGHTTTRRSSSSYFLFHPWFHNTFS